MFNFLIINDCFTVWNRIKKNILKLFFLCGVFLFSFSFSLFPLSIDSSDLLIPKQMKKDIDYFVKFVSKSHPNIYAFVSKDSLMERINILKKKCLTPMTVYNFERLILQLNGMFDSHTRIGINLNIPDGELLFIEHIKIEDLKLYILHNNVYNEVLEINGMSTESMLEFFRNVLNYELKHAQDLYISSFFPNLLYKLTDCRAPFKLRLKDVLGYEFEFLIEGKKDNGRPLVKPMVNYKRDFRSFPKDSIAIFYYHSCAYNSKEQKNEFSNWIDGIFEKISNEQIKYLFIDISRNSGGNTSANDIIYRKIEHDSISFSLYLKTIISPYIIKREVPLILRPVARIKYRKNIEKVLEINYPHSDGYKGNIYLIQGPVTFSSAINMSAWFRFSGRGIIIGEETGNASSGFSEIIESTLPYSKLPISCAISYYEYPEGKIDQGFLPDIPIKLDYTKTRYSLEDLKQFIKITNKYKISALCTN